MASAADLNPLELLQAQIDEAAALPAAEPYLPSDDPLARLQRHFRGDEVAANDDAQPPVSVAPVAASSATGVEAMIGREVLAMVASRPLPPEAREEAVRRLLMALQNPAPDNIRSVLAVLITGRDDA